MAMADTILFVKEAKTCSYVMVIHTPRLCGEPGFKSRRDATEEALIRCREIVDTVNPNTEQASLPEAEHPFKLPTRKPILPAPGEQV
jgi:protein OS-9